MRGKIRNGEDRVGFEIEAERGAVGDGVDVDDGAAIGVFAGPRHKVSPPVTELLEEGLQRAPFNRLPDKNPFEPVHCGHN